MENFDSPLHLLLLSPPLISSSETGVQSEAERALILDAGHSIACLFASIRWSTRKHLWIARIGGDPYLAAFRDEIETPGDRSEWTKGICGVSNPAEE